MDHGYPAKVEGTVERTECLTRYGPYAYVRAEQLRYTLPLPPLKDRGYIRGSDPENRKVLLNRLVNVADIAAGTAAVSGASPAFQAAVSAQMSWTWLDGENRESLAAAWAEILGERPTAGFGGDGVPGTPVTVRKPFAKMIQVERGGIGSGAREGQRPKPVESALFIYGLLKQAEYGGAWDPTLNTTPAMRNMIRLLEEGGDWVWMAPVAHETGIDTGDGADLSAAYCGTVG